MSELSPEEVVIIICGRKQSEESSETISNLRAVESPHDHKQQTSDTLEIAAAAKTKHLSCARVITFPVLENKLTCQLIISIK